MYHAPGKGREFNALVLDKSYFGPYDETTCIDWTDDSKSVLLLRPPRSCSGTFDMLVVLGSRCFAVGSKDMSTWVFGAERWSNLLYYSLGGHKDVVLGCFFQKDSLDVS